jgi:DNA ligase-1
VRFLELANVFEKLEGTPRRLEMRSLLSELFKPLRPPELSTVVYLAQGLLRPEYEGVELGVAESLARRSLALASGRSEETIGRSARTRGDLGDTAEEILRTVTRLDTPKPLEVKEVYARFLDIAERKGDGSQEAKVAVLADLLRRALPLEGKYLIRFAVGTLRVGVRELTILDALNAAFADGSKEGRQTIEAAFNLTSDLGELAERLAEGGLAALAHIRLRTGRPIRPMLAERASSLEELLERMEGTAALEYKYDGLRVQAHVPSKGPVRLFSRRLGEIGPQFPELLEAIPQALARRPAIIEGECVPIDPKTGAIRPFQEISRRRGRKRELERFQSEVPVVLFAFDVLLEGEEETYRWPFPKRREALERILRPSDRVRLAEERIVHSVEEARDYFEEVVGEGAEGIMGKSLAEGSAYRAGARGFWWIKYKRDYVAQLADSIDGVVVGGFHGRGRRAGRFGAYLLAAYDATTGRFPTFCKVGSGFDDALLQELPRRLASAERPTRPPDVDSTLTPDMWFEPQLVIEVRGAELSRSPVHRAGHGHLGDDVGLALRFPRFTGRVRDDKGPTDATTTDELLAMYAKAQRVRTRAGPVRPKA